MAFLSEKVLWRLPTVLLRFSGANSCCFRKGSLENSPNCSLHVSPSLLYSTPCCLHSPKKDQSCLRRWGCSSTSPWFLLRKIKGTEFQRKFLATAYGKSRLLAPTSKTGWWQLKHVLIFIPTDPSWQFRGGSRRVPCCKGSTRSRTSKLVS